MIRLYIVFRYTGMVLLLNAAFLAASAGVSLLYGDGAFFPLIFSALITVLFGLFPLVFVPPVRDINNREGLAIVVLSWLSSCLAGTLPYIMWGGAFTVTNAFFESVSGFTTTGATILSNIEALPEGLLFWRSATHWMGGVGIIIFALYITPGLKTLGNMLYRSEMSPVSLEQFNMSSRKGINILLRVYIGITVLETAALMLCGLDLFDAVTHSFGTVATGGFSPKNLSIGAYNSASVEIVVMFFMLVSGMNFAFLFATVTGKLNRVRGMSVVKYYLLINAAAVSLVSLNLWLQQGTDFLQALRGGAFQVLSIGTSTGFATADSSIWPGFSQMILIFLTLHCASAGSTSGGIKADRFLILFKSVLRRFTKIRHPSGVINVTMDGRRLEDEMVESSLIFIIFYTLIVFTAALALTLLGLDIITAVSGSAACMGNVGPGLGEVGSLENYLSIPSAGKWILSAVMILGRLEIYGLIAFLIPKTWRS